MNKTFCMTCNAYYDAACPYRGSFDCPPCSLRISKRRLNDPLTHYPYNFSEYNEVLERQIRSKSAAIGSAPLCSKCPILAKCITYGVGDV